MFTHLHLHSHYSLLEAIWSPKAYVQRAKELWMNSLALTDYNGMYGVIEFYKEAIKNDIKPLIWVELWIVHDLQAPTKETKTPTITLLAQNNSWYQNLLKLVSRANMEWYNYWARIDFSMLDEYGKDLIAIIWWQYSIIWKMIIEDQEIQKQHETVSLIQSACGKDSTFLEYITRKKWDDKKEDKVNAWILQIHHTLWVPLIASNNVHYLNSWDATWYSVAMSIKDGKRIYDDSTRPVLWDQSMISQTQIEDILLNNGIDDETIKVIHKNIESIVEICTVTIELWKILFPNYTSPKAIQELYAHHKSTLISQT